MTPLQTMTPPQNMMISSLMKSQLKTNMLTTKAMMSTIQTTSQPKTAQVTLMIILATTALLMKMKIWQKKASIMQTKRQRRKSQLRGMTA